MGLLMLDTTGVALLLLAVQCHAAGLPGAQYPAGVDPRKCINYPFCAPGAEIRSDKLIAGLSPYVYRYGVHPSFTASSKQKPITPYTQHFGINPGFYPYARYYGFIPTTYSRVSNVVPRVSAYQLRTDEATPVNNAIIPDSSFVEEKEFDIAPAVPHVVQKPAAPKIAQPTVIPNFVQTSVIQTPVVPKVVQTPVFQTRVVPQFLQTSLATQFRHTPVLAPPVSRSYSYFYSGPFYSRLFDRHPKPFARTVVQTPIFHNTIVKSTPQVVHSQAVINPVRRKIIVRPKTFAKPYYTKTIVQPYYGPTHIQPNNRFYTRTFTPPVLHHPHGCLNNPQCYSPSGGRRQIVHVYKDNDIDDDDDDDVVLKQVNIVPW